MYHVETSFHDMPWSVETRLQNTPWRQVNDKPLSLTTALKMYQEIRDLNLSARIVGGV